MGSVAWTEIFMGVIAVTLLLIFLFGMNVAG